MNRFLTALLMFRLMENADPAGGSPVGAAVADPPADAPIPALDNTQNTSIPDATGTTEPVASDPNSPFAALNDAMNAVLPKDDATAQPDGTISDNQGAVPEQFLKISPYVTSPESLQQAIGAADEVWKVASGEIPARNLIESIRQSNPQAADAIINDLRDYLGAGQQQTSPLDELKAANPQAFAEIAKYYQQVTGKAIDGPLDPYQQRLNLLEQRIASEDQQRETAAHNAQIDKARGVASEWLNKAITGTFADGLSDRFIAPGTGLLWQKAMQLSIDPGKLQGELLQGKTETLERVWKAVEKDEAAVIKRYNENLIKTHNKLKNAVPAVGSGKAPTPKQSGDYPPYLPGETAVQYATRIKNLAK